MDYSNRDDVQPSGSVSQSGQWPLWVGLILVVVAVILACRALVGWYNANETKRAATDYTAFMAAARQAEGIADPLQRCLNYPHLPGTHWDDATTQAYCQMLNRPTLKLSDIDTLLQQGKADEVDDAFRGYLETQLHDPRQPGVLDSAMENAGFDKADANTRKIIDTWKQQAPDSAFALAASGMQYVDAAQQARGNGWAHDLGDDQVDGMHHQLVLARQDLERAVTLLPALTRAYASMIYAGALEGDDDYMDKAAASGLAIDPSNYTLRRQMMNQAQSKWGSAFGGEDAQKTEDEALIARNPLLRMVAQSPALYRAICDDCGESVGGPVELYMAAADHNLSYGNMTNLANEAYDNAPRLTVEFYSEALRFNPTDPDVLLWRAQEMVKLGDAEGAIESVAQAAQRFPDDNAIGTKLGTLYASTGHVKEAESAFLAVLKRDPDSQRAMAELGDLYNHAGHQPDKAEVLADTLISRHPENPDGYIVRACNQMDHNLPGRYDTIHYFIDHFGDRPEFKSQVAEMRAYLTHHPEKTSTG